MLEVEEKGYNSDTLTRQPFRLSKKWKKKFTPNINLDENHLINHNLINHNLSRISDRSKGEDSCTSAIIKSESIESDLDDIQILDERSKMNLFKDTFRPSCPDFEPTDCPFACCVFLCLLAKHSRSKKRNEKNKQKRSLKHSSNSIQSNCNTTASTVQEDDIYGKSNLPTRSSSQTNLNSSNIRGSTENLPVESIEQPDHQVDQIDQINHLDQINQLDQVNLPTNYDQLNDEMRRLDKNTQV